MRSTGTVSALLFLLLLLPATAQAIRLPREYAASSSNHIGKLQQEEDNWVGAYNVEGEVVLCRNGHCSGAGGSSRKLMSTTNTISSTPESTKGERVEKKSTPPGHHESQQGFDKKQEDFSIKPTHPAETTKTTTTKYPDVFDLAGMDYSPAKRKPPIHN